MVAISCEHNNSSYYGEKENSPGDATNDHQSVNQHQVETSS